MMEDNELYMDVDRYMEAHMQHRRIRRVSGGESADVRISRAWISDGTKDGNRYYLLHMITDGQALTYEINMKTWLRWRRTVNDGEARVRTLIEATRGDFRLTTITAPEIVAIHMTSEAKRQLMRHAEACHLTLSEYCRRKLLDGVPPRQALTEKEHKMLDDVSRIQAGISNYSKALNAALKGMPTEERLQTIVSDEAFELWREKMMEAVRIITNIKEKTRQ